MAPNRFAILSVLATQACITTARVAPGEYLAQNSPTEMMVVDAAGDVYVLSRPQIVGDQLVGIELGTPDTVSLPVADVYQAMVKRKSTAKTAALVGTLTLLSGAAVVFAASGGKLPPCRPPGDASVGQGKDHCDPTIPYEGGP